MDGTWNKVNIVQGVCSPAIVSEGIRIKLPLKRQVLKNIIKKDELKFKINMKNSCLKCKLVNIILLNLDLAPLHVTVLISQVLNYWKSRNRNMESTDKLILCTFRHSFCLLFPLPSVTTMSLSIFTYMCKVKNIEKIITICTAIIHHTDRQYNIPPQKTPLDRSLFEQNLWITLLRV